MNRIQFTRTKLKSSFTFQLLKCQFYFKCKFKIGALEVPPKKIEIVNFNVLHNFFPQTHIRSGLLKPLVIVLILTLIVNRAYA